MIIEIPKLDDFKRVNEIAKQVHELHVNWRPDIFVSVEEVIEKERFKYLIENKEIYVVKKENEIIGYITINTKERKVHGMHDRKVLEIDAIGVDENHRGNGAGTMLINYVIELARKNKYTDIYLSVNEENKEAIKLYEKIGMKIKNIHYSMKI